MEKHEKIQERLISIQDIESEMAKQIHSALICESHGSVYAEEAIDAALDYCEQIRDNLIDLHNYHRNLRSWTEEVWR